MVKFLFVREIHQQSVAKRFVSDSPGKVSSLFGICDCGVVFVVENSEFCWVAMLFFQAFEIECSE